MAQQQRRRQPAGAAPSKPRSGARQQQTQQRSAPQAELLEQRRRNAEIAGILLIAAGLFFLLTYMKFSGILGEKISGFVFGLTGFFAYAFPAVLICYGVFSIAQAGSANSSQKSLLALGVSLCVCALLHTAVSGDAASDSFLEFIVRAFDTGEGARRGGGLFGGILSYPSARYIGKGGTYLLYGTLVLIQIVVLTNISLKTAGTRAAGFLKQNAHGISERMADQLELQRARREEQNARAQAEREAAEEFTREQMRLSAQNARGGNDQSFRRQKGAENERLVSRPPKKPFNGLEELEMNSSASLPTAPAAPEVFAEQPVYEYQYETMATEGALPPSRFAAFAPPLKKAEAPAFDAAAIAREAEPTPEPTPAQSKAGNEPEYLGMGIFYPPKPRAQFKSVELKTPDEARTPVSSEAEATDEEQARAAVSQVEKKESEQTPENEQTCDVKMCDIKTCDIPPELYAGEYEKFLPPVSFEKKTAKPRGLGYPPRAVPTPPPVIEEIERNIEYSEPEPSQRFEPAAPPAEDAVAESQRFEPSQVEPSQVEPSPVEPSPVELPPNVVQFDTKPAPAPAPQTGAQGDGKKLHMDRYASPPVDVLNAAKYEPPAEDLPQKATLLEETLGTFGVSAKVINVTQGPVITRYELQPAPGVRVNRITNLSDDLALALAAPRVRIEAPIPGKAAIGIEVPNKHTTPVMLREIVQSREFKEQKSKLAVCLGKDIAGKPIVADLAKMPHLLIAGSTGSGKSVCINCIICSIVYHAMPEDVRLIMVDPKVVELAAFDNLPHLLIPVVTEPKHAANALKWGVNEMVKRYNNFAAVGARDLHRYNEITMAQGAKRTPQILVIIDELADLMMVAPDDVEDAICRIAQMGRAAGIHLVVATQRPSADVITGLIKANIPSRIAFAVASSMDSRIILDAAGADKLLGKGDMLFSPLGAGKPSRVQGAFVSDQEVEQIHDYFAKYDFSVDSLDEQELDDIESGNISTGGGSDGDDEELYGDELLPKAVEILMASGTASISMLQRRLRIGYARAARLIDIMEQYGVVSGYDGSKARKLLIDRAGYERMFGHAPNIADLGT